MFINDYMTGMNAPFELHFLRDEGQGKLFGIGAGVLMSRVKDGIASEMPHYIHDQQQVLQCILLFPDTKLITSPGVI